MDNNNNDEQGKDQAAPSDQDPKAEKSTSPVQQRPVVALGDVLGAGEGVIAKKHTRAKGPAKPKSGRSKRSETAFATLAHTPPEQHTADDAGEGQARISLAIINEPAVGIAGRRGRKAPGSFATFVVMAIAGSIVLALPQAFGISGLFKFFFAIAMVTLYGGCGLLFQWYQPKKGGQRYIDNVYFLGFLYTQVGLVAGFMELWQSSTVDASGIRRITSDELIPIIAAALGASALGLLFKIILDEIYELRITTDSASDEEKWREELGRAAEKLKIEVDGVITHFQNLSKNVVGVTSEIAGAVQLASTTAQAVENNGQTIAGSVQQLRPVLEQFRETLVSAGDAAAQGIRDVHGDLVSASQSLREIANAAQGMGRIVHQMDGVVGQMDGVVQTTRTASNVTEIASNEFKNEARARIGELAKRLEDLTRTTSSDARNGFSTTIREIEAELERTREALGQHVDKFAGAVREFNSKVDGR